MEDTEQRQAPKPFLWLFGTELNFTNSSFRDLSAFEHDYSFTYGCDYKYIISLRFCLIKILNYRDFLAAFFSHKYHTNQQILFTTRKNNHLHSKGRELFNCCCPQKSFVLHSESLAGSFYPSVTLEYSPIETSVVHFSLKPQHFPTAIK